VIIATTMMAPRMIVATVFEHVTVFMDGKDIVVMVEVKDNREDYGVNREMGAALIAGFLRAK
jgi:hypothetical protein